MPSCPCPSDGHCALMPLPKQRARTGVSPQTTGAARQRPDLKGTVHHHLSGLEKPSDLHNGVTEIVINIGPLGPFIIHNVLVLRESRGNPRICVCPESRKRQNTMEHPLGPANQGAACGGGGGDSDLTRNNGTFAPPPPIQTTVKFKKVAETTR